MRAPRSVGAVERWSSAAALGALLVTPFTGPQSHARFLATSVSVGAGAMRSIAVDARRPSVGTRRALRAAGLTAALATAVEVVGVRVGLPFGRYRYTRTLRPQIGGVPLHVPLAWTAMVPAAETVAQALLEAPGSEPDRGSGPASGRAAAGRRIVAGALAMTAWDLFLDPQMTRDGVWVWSRDGRYRGVPVQNFAGWLLASAGLIAARRVTTRSDEPEPAHVVTYAVMAGMSTLAFSTFWRDRTVALIGGAAMLPPAMAALRRVGAESTGRRGRRRASSRGSDMLDDVPAPPTETLTVNPDETRRR